MKSETNEAAKVKLEPSAKPRAIALAVVIGVVLAVIFAWLLGFSTWLLS